MRLGIYIKKKELAQDAGYLSMVSGLKSEGVTLYEIREKDDIRPDTDFVLSIGGDGTFLSASKRVADGGIPILGVNLGRLGFLSENRPEDVVDALLSGAYVVENRTMLNASLSGNAGDQDIDFWPYALNEVTLHRAGAAMLGIKVVIDGAELPMYWADGLLVATSSGSTAYSLSLGGPICMPEAKVLIISPIAPHNLNVRPLVVPETANIRLSLQSRDSKAVFTMDNRTMEIDPSSVLTISMAQFSLKRVRLVRSNFVKALTSKLFWGEDVRNKE